MTQLKNLHIVIAEDDTDDAEIIQNSFDKHAAFKKVDVVNNGKELLTFLKDTATKPDVILTDINMPILNGIEALKEISEDNHLKDIPAFVYSTTINPVYEAKSLELNSKGFLIKPYDLKGFDEIPEKIVNILDNL